jgi:hypothetical protein
MAGLRLRRFDDWEAEAEHYRRAARLDSTFAAPLIQLAHLAWLSDDCKITDSVGAVLEPRRELLNTWNRTTMYAMRAFCEGDVEEGVSRLGQRYHAYPRSASAQVHYAWVLLGSNHQRAAVRILVRLDPERDLGWWDTPAEVWPRYWERLAGARHALREYSAELDVTDRW